MGQNAHLDGNFTLPGIARLDAIGETPALAGRRPMTACRRVIRGDSFDAS